LVDKKAEEEKREREWKGENVRQIKKDRRLEGDKDILERERKIYFK
jgi:hypothetical protein